MNNIAQSLRITELEGQVKAALAQIGALKQALSCAICAECADHIADEEFELNEEGTMAEYHYTRSGQGIIDAVCKLFERGTFILGEGDALIPVQDAYLKYKEARELWLTDKMIAEKAGKEGTLVHSRCNRGDDNA